VTSIRARVVSNDGQTSLIESDTACRGCQGCAVEKSKSVTISGTYEGRVLVTLESRQQWRALVHSLLLPLITALVLAFVADLLLADEIFGIIAAFCGFSIGMRLCKQLNPAALKVTKPGTKNKDKPKKRQQ